jgi:glyoxylase-like metal-dependent hydrolase (beta-lactamase superfamily II)
MQRALVWLVCLLIVEAWLRLAWAASPNDPAALVQRAVTALGDVQVLSQMQRLTLKGRVRHWDPEQSMVAGGEFRLAGDSTFELLRDFEHAATRINWVRKLAYPAPREYVFSEILAQGIGYVAGVDTVLRTKQSVDAHPPAHAMSGVRVAATLRELQRASPLLVLEMQNHPKRLGQLPAQTVEGGRLPAVSYHVGTVQFIVMFDPSTALPVRIRTIDDDTLYGNSNFDLVLSDWRAVQGVQLAHELTSVLHDKVIAQTQYTEVQINPVLEAPLFDIPEAIRAVAPPAATSEVPYQWIIRRQYIGTYLDSDKVIFDPSVSAGLHLVELAPGVQHIVDGTHNSLLVEMDKYLILFDAPINTTQSRWTLDAAKAKYPDKPIQYVVLTHHHIDHIGGAAAYVATGATMIMGTGNGEHFRKIWTAKPQGARASSPPPKMARPTIVEVAERYVLSDGKREVEIYNIENPHAKGMLIGYVKDARLGFVTDLWSPGRDRVGEKLTPGQAALVAAVKKIGLTPERFAGGHGSVANYTDLEAVVSQNN